MICALKGFNCIAVREGRTSKHYLPNDLNKGSHRKGVYPSPKLKSDVIFQTEDYIGRPWGQPEILYAREEQIFSALVKLSRKRG